MSSLNITITDQSPAFAYFPDRESASSGWHSTWTGSPDSSYDSTHTQSNIAQGTSSHVTTLAGATVQFDFVGSAVSVYGQGTAGAYTVTLDGGSPVSGVPMGPMLATYGGLNDSVKHTILLTTTQSQALTLSYATFTIRSHLAPSSVVNTTITAVTTGANNSVSTNSFFSETGSGFSNLHQDDGYTRIDTNSAGSSISFSCSNTSALYIYGTSNWNHQTFSIEIEPPAGASPQGGRIFNGTSKWFVLDNLVFFESGLDPTQTYQVKMTNLVDGSYSDIHSVRLPSSPFESTSTGGSVSASSSLPSPSSTSGSGAGTTSPPKKSSTAGKTAAIAASLFVGAVAVVAAAIIVAFFCWRRRAKNKRNRSRLSLSGMMVTPFEDNPHPSPPTTMSTNNNTPMNLSHLEPTASSYAGYSINSASNSVKDFGTRGTGHGVQYSELSTRGSGDFDPYSPDLRPPQPFAARSASFLGSTSAAASGSGSGLGLRSQSQPESRPSSQVDAQLYSSGKGPIPSEASSSSRPIRHEVDAGRIPLSQEEETLPPTYDATWV
ncbi:hypothetical protein GGX14DRAFT_413230 [Mycena pura]|uniref:Uncharacterized protein n=1 Tax=Mycena pura TaxID=153505 RepID=A0AAD7E4H4_9AGAR|nr:hypothetical protein GGX14DRAFT_413230 [Mycena pura]